MRKLILVLGCALALVHPTAILSQVQSGAPAEKPVNHGGKIDSKYDGFNYETVVRLQKMKVTCDGAKDKFVKDGCVSIEVSLHCPGVQLDYVRNVTVQIMFENKDWVHIHPLDQRDLRVVIDTETLKLGRMQLANTAVPGKWDTKLEVLEATIPYTAFKKIAQSQAVEFQVGQSAFELREKNRLALRDLDSRVMDTRAKN